MASLGSNSVFSIAAREGKGTLQSAGCSKPP
ncbi:hypothetical protein CGRA01v4_08324 [Colletotrichum graminicola]|nr:hypothetical protein CGRA01v4_08324 [Colletotrichum graminicola]